MININQKIMSIRGNLESGFQDPDAAKEVRFRISFKPVVRSALLLFLVLSQATSVDAGRENEDKCGLKAFETGHSNKWTIDDYYNTHPNMLTRSTTGIYRQLKAVETMFLEENKSLMFINVLNAPYDGMQIQIDKKHFVVKISRSDLVNAGDSEKFERILLHEVCHALLNSLGSPRLFVYLYGVDKPENYKAENLFVSTEIFQEFQNIMEHAIFFDHIRDYGVYPNNMVYRTIETASKYNFSDLFISKEKDNIVESYTMLLIDTMSHIVEINSLAKVVADKEKITQIRNELQRRLNHLLGEKKSISLYSTAEKIIEECQKFSMENLPTREDYENLNVWAHNQAHFLIADMLGIKLPKQGPFFVGKGQDDCASELRIMIHKKYLTKLSAEKPRKQKRSSQSTTAKGRNAEGENREKSSIKPSSPPNEL